MGEWILPTLSQLLMQEGCESSPPISESSSIAARRLKAEQAWIGAVGALENCLKQAPEDARGVVFSGPLPLLSQPQLLERFSSWVFTADLSLTTIASFFQLPPALQDAPSPSLETNATLPLLPGDPLAAEQFCLALTPSFSLVMVLGENVEGEPNFCFSFDPEQVQKAWQILRLRVGMLSQQQMQHLDRLVETVPPIAPPYQTVTQFSHDLLSHMPEVEPSPYKHPIRDSVFSATHSEASSSASALDVELLQAIAHEVRTPLTTIRTLTRLLLRRKDMPPDALKRLEVIDRECSEQIDRFGLIFRAVEIETSASKGVALTSTCLSQVFNQSIPRWQQQAQQRGLKLDVLLPKRMPSVVSDPTMLDQALTSLIERSARTLPAGSRIQVEVSLAGDQLKLQLETTADESCKPHQPLLKSLGQMLTFQPETGVLSLNLTVTKNLFHALGGKLTVKQSTAHPGEVFTVFLPLQPESIDLGLFEACPTHLV